jgi:hypothetical protein
VHTITASGRFDAHRIAVMLYKAALGAIQLEKCHEVALDPRFDEIRRYIVDGGTFPNKMALSKKGHPSSSMRVEREEVEGVPKAKLVILGFKFAIILGKKPKLDSAREPQPVIIFDLSLEKPEPGVVHAND